MTPTLATAAPAVATAAQSSIEPKAATMLKLVSLTPPRSLYGLNEFEIETDAIVSNRFDPAEFDLWVRFTAPSGRELLVPAFSYQAIDPDTLVAQGEPTWRVRFTATEVGEWQAQAELISPTLRSEPLQFTVAPDEQARGFMRLHPENPRYYAFDNGDFYFPIGPNLGWSVAPGRGVLDDYERWLDRLSQNGGNVGRVWMASWSFGIEWKDTGLGDYTKRMRQAWLLDQVFQLAEERGVYLMLTLLNHGAFSESVNPEWNDNPYNQANGGPLKAPRDFARNREAKALFQQRLRYMVARWGYSPNLFAWEWWNEVNWTPIDDPALKEWIREMDTHLERYDPYKHLVSSSFAGVTSSQTWQLPEIDFTQQHDYSGDDPAKLLPVTFHVMNGYAPEKPVLLAEQGLDAAGASGQVGVELVHFHNGIWAAPFSGYAGSAMYWWWDHYIDPNNLWGEYRGLATFLEGETLVPLAPTKTQLDSDAAIALALQSPERALVWVRSNAYTIAAARNAYEQARAAESVPSDWRHEPPPINDLTLTLQGLNNGDYLAEWFSPHSATWLESQPIAVSDGSVTLTVPSFNQDIALRLRPNN